MVLLLATASFGECVTSSLVLLNGARGVCDMAWPGLAVDVACCTVTRYGGAPLQRFHRLACLLAREKRVRAVHHPCHPIPCPSRTHPRHEARQMLLFPSQDKQKDEPFAPRSRLTTHFSPGVKRKTEQQTIHSCEVMRAMFFLIPGGAIKLWPALTGPERLALPCLAPFSPNANAIYRGCSFLARGSVKDIWALMGWMAWHGRMRRRGVRSVGRSGK